MRKALAIFISIILAFVGLYIGNLIGGKDNNVVGIIVGIVCALAFSFGYYYYRKNKEKCKKCGALWSVKLSNTETLTQSVVSETEKTSTVNDYNIVVERNREGLPKYYGKKDIYKTTNYLVGEEKLTYRCDKCGDEVSKVQKYKRRA